MMEENTVAFSIIAYAGDAKATALQAVEAAKEGDFEQAQSLMDAAFASLTEAHKVQTDLIFKAANGEHVDVDIFLVHSQDHLTMGTMAIENARQLIDLYRVIYNKK